MLPRAETHILYNLCNGIYIYLIPIYILLIEYNCVSLFVRNICLIGSNMYCFPSVHFCTKLPRSRWTLCGRVVTYERKIKRWSAFDDMRLSDFSVCGSYPTKTFVTYPSNFYLPKAPFRTTMIYMETYRICISIFKWCEYSTLLFVDSKQNIFVRRFVHFEWGFFLCLLSIEYLIFSPILQLTVSYIHDRYTLYAYRRYAVHNI